MEQRLEIKMLQKLVLTPQLQQAIKLLQLPQLELEQAITNELVENPFLEETSEETQAAEEGPQETKEGESFQASEEAEAPLEKLLGFGADEYFESRSHDGRDLGYFSPDVNPVQSLEQYVSQSTDLYENLTWQLRFSDAAEDVRAVAEVVIGNIDCRRPS
jgi:RNA polymerase sigma-54 factor